MSWALKKLSQDEREFLKNLTSSTGIGQSLQDLTALWGGGVKSKSQNLDMTNTNKEHDVKIFFLNLHFIFTSFFFFIINTTAVTYDTIISSRSWYNNHMKF